MGWVMVDLLSTGQTAQLRPRTAAIVTAVLEQEERYSRHLFLISGHWDLRCARDLPRWHPHSAGPRQAFTVAFAARVTDLGPRQEEQVPGVRFLSLCTLIRGFNRGSRSRDVVYRMAVCPLIDFRHDDVAAGKRMR